MRMSKSILGMAVIVALACGGAAAQQKQADAGDKEQSTPSWEALSQQAKDASMGRYSTEDLETQIEKREEHLDSLNEQRVQLRKKLIQIVTATRKSVEQIETIQDPVLRDESLLQFDAEKNVRLATLQSKLRAVKSEIEREQKELDMLYQLLQSRQAEARLHGREVSGDVSYEAYLSQHADRVRQATKQMLKQLREARLRELENAILPVLAPRVPDATSAVMWSNRE